MHLREILVATMAVLLPAAASAAPIAGPYVSLGAGYNILQDESARFSPGAFANGGSGYHGGTLPGHATYDFGDGFDGQGSLGWGFGNGLRAELEGDYYQNDVDYRRGSIYGSRTHGHSESYGPMVNILYDIDLSRFGLILPVTPYVGVGAGYQWTHLSPLSTRFTPGTIDRVGGTNGSFAYQGIVGVSYDIAPVPGLAVTAEYRFLGTLNQDAYDSTSYTPTGLHKANADLTDEFNHSFMLGVRYAFDTAPPPPLPQPPPVPAAAPPEQARTYLVFFDWDRSDLTDRARGIVTEAAQASTRVRTTRIEVDGYTDNSSIHGGARGAQYNQGLSLRRATSVQAELIRDGVPATAIGIHGYGEGHPLVTTGPDTREPQNRRVEIVLH